MVDAIFLLFCWSKTLFTLFNTESMVAMALFTESRTGSTLLLMMPSKKPSLGDAFILSLFFSITDESPRMISTLVMVSGFGLICAKEFAGMLMSLCIEKVTISSFMERSLEIDFTVPTCNPLMITGFDGVSPCTLSYLAYKVIDLVNNLFPFKKLNPRTSKAMAITPKMPILNSLDTFTFFCFFG